MHIFIYHVPSVYIVFAAQKSLQIEKLPSKVHFMNLGYIIKCITNGFIGLG